MAGKGEFSFWKPIEWVKGKVIGSGSFGTVCLAMDNATGALFVVKSADSDAGIMSLENEANILDKLDSPNIVKCVGNDLSFAENGKRRYNLFFEYMPGGSLSDVAEKFGGVLDEKVIRLYTREILRGLKYLHGKGIVHSDVKCKNVLLGLSGTVKLADFGCAKKLTDKKTNNKVSSSRNWIAGTPLWMAPEVLRNEGLDFPADIWSLGCTVIEMATGKQPWGHEITNPMAEVLKIAKGNEIPNFPGHLSLEGIDFLAKCLERDPYKRWTSEMLLDHPFIAGGNLISSRNEYASSPACVLDVRNYDTESEDEFDDEFVSKISLISTKPRWETTSCFESSSENWITVRTGHRSSSF